MITVFFLMLSKNVISQSKKKQIEILQNKVDSLFSVLDIDKKISLKIEIEFKEQISILQNQLTFKEKELNSKSLNITNLENDINQRNLQIIELKNQIDELNTKLEQLKSSSVIELIDVPSFSISNYNLIKIVDSKMIEPCPTDIDLSLTEKIDCEKNVTKISYFKIDNKLRFFACVGYSYDGARSDSGQNGFLLAEYVNSNWVVIDFLQVQLPGSFGQSIDIGSQFLLGKNSIGYYGVSIGTGQGTATYESYLVGFVNDKIAVLLNEISGENNFASDFKPKIDWEYKYYPLKNENQIFTIERKLFKFNKLIKSDFLNFNQKTMKFEL